MKKILFICTGNTCRSPMAEAFMKDFISRSDKLRNNFTTASAGISVISGNLASENSIRILQNEWQLDLSRHIAKQVKEEMIEESYMIFTMTFNHRELIMNRFDNARGKTFTLKEYILNKNDITPKKNVFKYDIIDPYGMPLQVYQHSAIEIRNAVQKLSEYLESDIEEAVDNVISIEDNNNNQENSITEIDTVENNNSNNDNGGNTYTIAENNNNNN